MDDIFNISFDLWSAILLFGLFQGLFFMGILLLVYPRNLSNMFLSLLLFTVVFNLFNYLILHSHLYRFSPHLTHLATPFLLLLGPCYYFYIRSLWAAHFRVRASDLLHVIPFLLTLVFFMPFYTLDGTAKIAFLDAQMASEKQVLTPDVYGFLIFQILHSFGYIYFSIKMLKRGGIGNHPRVLENKYRWLQKFGFAFLIFWAMDFIGVLWFVGQGEIHREAYYITMLGCAVVINVLLVFALKNNKVFTEIFLNQSREKYEASKAPPSELRKLSRQIVSYMEQDRAYLDAELSLSKLADHLETPKYLISQALNMELGTSFYELLNTYRYREVKRRLKDPQYRHLTILAIALDAGFNNKNTFNKVFKKHAGVTPSRFLQSSTDLK
ncbi:helix-turn-helix transcriptional regulator [Flavobacteriaceae bacterium 3-367]|uniref:helix-turn-helix transcriptional regulator n=1 Tax=Eudoraea algarum TaxID=3417568 RepID=UPI0032957804